MTDLVVGALNGRPIQFLDVSPMIAALRSQPTDFEFSRGWLLHVPTRHRFCFDHSGGVTIDAHCGCSGMAVGFDQGRELSGAFNAWRDEYWRPLVQNREFADHFRTPERLGAAVARHPHGLAPVPRPRRADHPDPRCAAIGDRSALSRGGGRNVGAALRRRAANADLWLVRRRARPADAPRRSISGPHGCASALNPPPDSGQKSLARGCARRSP